MSTKEKCQAECMVFTGGEIKHDENCVFYPESLTKVYADLRKENEEMKMMLKSVKRFFDNTPHLTEMQKPMVLNGIESLIQKHKQ